MDKLIKIRKAEFQNRYSLNKKKECRVLRQFKFKFLTRKHRPVIISIITSVKKKKSFEKRTHVFMARFKFYIHANLSTRINKRSRPNYSVAIER